MLLRSGESANLGRVVGHTHGSAVEGGTVIGPLTSLTAANNLDIGAFQLSAATFQSTVANGTAPFIVASLTKVVNLNADLLDGLNSGNANGNIPINNGVLNVNLNAQFFNSLSSTDFVRTTGNVAQQITGIKTFNNNTGFNGVLDPVNPIALPDQSFIAWKDAGSSGVETVGLKGEGGLLTVRTAGGDYARFGAGYLQFYNAGVACIIPASTLLCVNLNADLLDGAHAGNANGNVALNNGVLNTNLNAQFLNSLASTDFVRATGAVDQTVTGIKTYTRPAVFDTTGSLSHPPVAHAGVYDNQNCIAAYYSAPTNNHYTRSNWYNVTSVTKVKDGVIHVVFTDAIGYDVIIPTHAADNNVGDNYGMSILGYYGQNGTSVDLVEMTPDDSPFNSTNRITGMIAIGAA